MLSQKLKNYIFFGIYLILNPKLFYLIVQEVYIPVYIQYEWLRSYKVDTFIDVGAYKGRVTKVINYLFPKVRIYAFEPLVENYNSIKAQKFSSDATVEKLALGAHTGKSTFYKSSFIPASSLLQFKKNLGKYEFIKKIKKVQVETNTLDNYFKKIILRKNVVLKLDTQGSEYFILNSGKIVLKEVSIVIIETSFKGLYRGEKDFAQVYELLVRCGFEYRGNISDSVFYPNFNLSDYSNSVFVKRKQNKLQ